MSRLCRDPLLGVVVEGADGQFLVRPATDLKPEDWAYSQTDMIAYSTGASPIKLEATQYDTGEWGNHQPGYIRHTMVDQLAIMVLYDFLGEADFERALREVVQKYPTAKGWLIDERMNTGGGPHQDTLASFFLDEPIDLPTVEFKSGPAHDALTPCEVTTCPTTLAPDAKIHVTAPVAVLTSGFTVSAGDFFAYDMTKAPRARIFGQPTNGAFGNVSLTQPTSTISYSITWTQVSDTDGTPMQGRSIQPHELVWFKKADVVNGVDTVFESARAWLVSQQ